MKELEPLAKKVKEECKATRKKVEVLQGHFGPDHINRITVQDAFRKLKNAERASEKISTFLETRSRRFLRATSLKAQLGNVLSDLRSLCTALYTLFPRAEHREPLAVLFNDALVVRRY